LRSSRCSRVAMWARMILKELKILMEGVIRYE
jgi:hypothetical protein